MSDLYLYLSRREREIMDVVYRLGEASASEVARRMHDDPGYDTVRVTLANLAKKGFLTRRRDGRRHIFSPAVPHSSAERSAVQNLLQTFFAGSPSKAILSILDVSSKELSEEELDRIAAFIEKEKEP